MLVEEEEDEDEEETDGWKNLHPNSQRPRERGGRGGGGFGVRCDAALLRFPVDAALFVLLPLSRVLPLPSFRCLSLFASRGLLLLVGGIEAWSLAVLMYRLLCVCVCVSMLCLFVCLLACLFVGFFACARSIPCSVASGCAHTSELDAVFQNSEAALSARWKERSPG